ncbi:MAG TPA: efflux RND transporter periplasmic adaptor subunit [Gemmatimonadales bacterium]
MDVARPPKKQTGRNIGIGAGVVALVFLVWFFWRMKPADPTYDMSSGVMDSVRRGDLVREVRGPGTLVPEQIQIVTAQSNARVDRLVAQSGQNVAVGDVLLEMSSPDLEISTLNADQNLNQAKATLLSLRTSLRSNELAQQGTVATMHTQYVQALNDATASDTLVKLHLISVFDATNKHNLADEMTSRLHYEQQRLDDMIKSDPDQLKSAEANVAQLTQIAAFYHERQKDLTVRAPSLGVVQGLTLQQGQFVTDGSTLLKIVQPGKLKAVLQIPESQAKDVVVGLLASIDTRSNGLIAGHVSRKDPSAVAGTVTIDVALEGALPPGAVPDLSVDGTIQIEKLHDVLYTGRPSYGAATGQVGLFKIADNGHAAVRTQVVLGRSSVTAVEVIRGLAAGDKVILSDMSQFDNVDRVRLKQ